MAHNTYEKLIRDNIPAIIERRGGRYATATMAEGEYRRALRAKLVEEAREVVEAATEPELATELADVCEVLDALLAAHGLAPDAVRAVQRRRREERGGFDRRLMLLWTEE